MAPQQVLPTCVLEAHQPLKWSTPATSDPFLPPVQADEAGSSSKAFI